VLSMIGVSAALTISFIPFNGPLGAVRIGMIDGKFVINPLASERPKSTLDLVVAGTKDAITMVECGAQQIGEAKLVEALELAHSQIKIVVAAIESLRAKVGKPKMAHVEPEVSPWVAAILAVRKSRQRTSKPPSATPRTWSSVS
jgi:polyribonucleotide nucleotidyltransferase